MNMYVVSVLIYYNSTRLNILIGELGIERWFSKSSCSIMKIYSKLSSFIDYQVYPSLLQEIGTETPRLQTPERFRANGAPKA